MIDVAWVLPVTGSGHAPGGLLDEEQNRCQGTRRSICAPGVDSCAGSCRPVIRQVAAPRLVFTQGPCDGGETGLPGQSEWPLGACNRRWAGGQGSGKAGRGRAGR